MADVAVLNVLLYVVDNGHKAPGRGRNFRQRVSTNSLQLPLRLFWTRGQA